MALNVFKGIEQVTEATYLGLTSSDKIGKLYLVKRHLFRNPSLRALQSNRD